MKSRKGVSWLIIIIGIILIVIALAIGLSWSLIFNWIRKEKLKLTPNSETYKLWVKTPIPMYLEIYLFNWTNAAEFMENKNVKPKFEEVGPFVFKEVHERVDVKWVGNHSVTYNQTRAWTFVPDKSVHLSVPITNLNVVASTVVEMASNYKNILKLLVDFLTFVYKEKLLITRPAEEWLFKGMEDKLLNFIKKFLPVPYDKFGWFYGRNMSSTFDGAYDINNGEENIFDLGKIKRWNHVNKTNFFNGDCSVVRGRSSELFSPVATSQSNISILISDFCGPITLNYSGTRRIENIDGYHYVGDESVFDNGTRYPDSKCFCKGECSPSGVRNVTSCRQAPLFISFPHFYLADASYTDSIIGMRPNQSEHEFHIDVDPLSGIPLDVRAQLQLNVLLRPMKLFSMFAEVPKLYIPMLWFRQRARATPELVSKSEKLRTLEELGPGLTWGLAAAGLLIISVNIFLIKFCSQNNESELLLPETSKDNDGQEELDKER